MTQPSSPQPLTPLDPDRDVSQNHYWNYHRLDDLLACKQPLTASKDEDLFIAVHQICEIAFHQTILDMERVLEALAEALEDSLVGDITEVRYFFERILRLYEVVLSTMPILTTMRAFAEFRTAIGPTSGFQSFQFRRLEIMSGVRHSYWQGGTKDASGNPHVAETEFERRYGADIAEWFERYRHHNLAHYYEVLLDRVSGSLDQKILCLQQHSHARVILEYLAAYDKLQARFHQSHLGLAVQQLKIVGADVGTGGTSFRDYLAKYNREQVPLFPGLTNGIIQN